jgi:hypothetical protein
MRSREGGREGVVSISNNGTKSRSRGGPGPQSHRKDRQTRNGTEGAGGEPKWRLPLRRREEEGGEGEVSGVAGDLRKCNDSPESEERSRTLWSAPHTHLAAGRAENSFFWANRRKKETEKREREKNKERERERMEFKIREVTDLKYGIKIETATRAVELEMTYEQMREIQETIKPLNPPAAALFPVYQLWLPFHFNISPTLDLERFQKVIES